MRAAWLAAVLMTSATAGMAAPAPIIDMHMHALAANEQGPPLAMCTPFEEFPAWDQRKTYSEIFFDRLKRPTCKDPTWSPTTDQALMRETIAVMDRLNIYGVLSGPYDQSVKWRKAAPARFFPALSFSNPAAVTPERLAQLHRTGELAVMGEVTTQ